MTKKTYQINDLMKIRCPNGKRIVFHGKMHIGILNSSSYEGKNFECEQSSANYGSLDKKCLANYCQMTVVPFEDNPCMDKRNYLTIYMSCQYCTYTLIIYFNQLQAVSMSDFLS